MVCVLETTTQVKVTERSTDGQAKEQLRREESSERRGDWARVYLGTRLEATGDWLYRSAQDKEADRRERKRETEMLIITFHSSNTDLRLSFLFSPSLHLPHVVHSSLHHLPTVVS